VRVVKRKEGESYITDVFAVGNDAWEIIYLIRTSTAFDTLPTRQQFFQNGNLAFGSVLCLVEIEWRRRNR
jgi:hypothetical protein